MRVWLAALCLGLLSCSPPEGRFLVATDTNRPPLAFLNDEKQLAGFEIDLLRAVAEAEGLDLSFKTVPEQGLLRAVPGFGILAGLDSGDYDAVVAATPISNSLREKYSVSDAYFDAGPVLVTASEAVAGLKDWKSGTLATVSEEASREAAKDGGARDSARPYYSLEGALEDLAEHRIGGVLAPGAEVAAALADNEKFRMFLRIVEGPLGDDYEYGVIVKRGRDELLNSLNRGLKSLEASGRLTELREKWLLR